MIATEIYGGMGKLFTPRPQARARYTFGIVTHDNSLSRPFLIFTNGKMVYEDMKQAGRTGVVSYQTMPAFMWPRAFPENDDVAAGFEEFRTAVTELLTPLKFELKEWEKHPRSIDARLMFGFVKDRDDGTDLNQDKVRVRKILTKVWPRLEPQGVKHFEDSQYTYLAYEQSWFEHALDDLQYIITMYIQPWVKGSYVPRLYGFGEALVDEEGVLIHRFPTNKVSYDNGRHVGIVEMTAEPDRPDKDKGAQFMYTYILARALQEFATRHEFFKHYIMQNKGHEYQFVDYMALASEFIADEITGGFGETKKQVNYVATDIQSHIIDSTGKGIAKAYAWQNYDAALAYDILKLQLLIALAAARVKVPTMPTRIRILQSKDKLKAAFDWSECSNAQLPGLGGESSVYCMMSTNKPQAGYLFLPMALRVDRENDKPNIYERNLTRKIPGGITKVQVKYGEIQGTPLEPMSEKERFIEWQIEADSRRWEITYPWYTLVIHRWPKSDYDQIVDDENKKINTRRYAAMMWILSSMANAQTAYSEGYFINDNIGLYGAVQLPVVVGHPNPIQMGIGVTLEGAAESTLTPRPEMISNTTTDPATQPPKPAAVPKLEGPVQTEGTAVPAPETKETSAQEGGPK